MPDEKPQKHRRHRRTKVEMLIAKRLKEREAKIAEAKKAQQIQLDERTMDMVDLRSMVIWDLNDIAMEYRKEGDRKEAIKCLVNVAKYAGEAIRDARATTDVPQSEMADELVRLQKKIEARIAEPVAEIRKSAKLKVV